MNGNDLLKLGIPQGEAIGVGLELSAMMRSLGASEDEVLQKLGAIADEPERFVQDERFGRLAVLLAPPGDDSQASEERRETWVERDEPAPWTQWGADLDPAAIEQLENASRLPVAIAGALMPDAHRGYGLPIGGVLATEGAVIPYAVGVDIACRMRLSVLDLPGEALDYDQDRLIRAVEKETSFGIGARFRRRRDHAVLDADWGVSEITRKRFDTAHAQLGSSGSGNHFVEFGLLQLDEPDLGLDPGKYLALLSHSGSRGVGAAVASHYSKLAREQHPELPKELRHLAWLELDSAEGQEYWAAMELMGEYAAANHECIHREILAHLGTSALATVENHHNFAWKERHLDRDVIVHRKGATPAGKGTLGVIPGSMNDPGFVIRGKGNAPSLESAAHGAGRVMSRRAAKRTIDWAEVERELERSGVRLLSAGVDEAPDVYKDIESVMAHQRDLVEVVARFDPKIVKMAPPGEPPED